MPIHRRSTLSYTKVEKSNVTTSHVDPPTFFHVSLSLQFSDKADVVGCFETFVQANYHNKKVLFDAIDQTFAKGMASYSKGFEFAFEQFEKVSLIKNKTVALWKGQVMASLTMCVERTSAI